MYKAIVYKEWLKIRWGLLGALIITAGILGNIWLNISHDMVFVEAKGYWYSVIFRGYQFYSNLLYLPLLVGILIGVLQFVPEINSDRLKLTLNLPQKENLLIFQMLTVGVVSLIIYMIFTFAGLSFVSQIYFPGEITQSALLTTGPWLLACIVAYLAVSAITTEPLWKHRIILIVFSYGFISTLLFSDGYNIYKRSLPEYIIMGLLFSLFIFYSGYRYRKGVM